VVLAGIPDSDRITYNAASARRKGLTVVNVRRMKEVYPRTIALVERGMIDVRSVVDHTFPLSEIGKAFAVAQAREGLKVIVEPNPTDAP
jgi:L-iditol 2-dehydrogenase